MKNDIEMFDGKVGTEDYDQVLRRLKDELEDITYLNTNIQVENHKKDLVLESSEAQLKKIRDIFIDESDQLELVISLYYL